MTDSNSAFHTRPSLLLRIKDAQDAVAWTAFVEIYAPLVYRYCRRKGLQDSDSADITQEVMAQVARSIRAFEYEPQRGRFRDWLGSVIHSKVMNHFRSGHRAGLEQTGAGNGLPELVAIGDPGSDWASEFNNHVLRAGLDRIRPHFEPVTWRLFERVWLQGQKASECAAAEGVPIDAVYVAKSRVLKRLREEVTALAEDLPLYVPLG
jgi:RNA polymerase sigma-70 factor (ECF subfamily)